MLKVGFRVVSIWACEKMMSPGRRLTRPAPRRMASSLTREMPLRFERIEPASDWLSGSLILLGGAKSRLPKLPDLRRAYLCHIVLGKSNRARHSWLHWVKLTG